MLARSGLRGCLIAAFLLTACAGEDGRLGGASDAPSVPVRLSHAIDGGKAIEAETVTAFKIAGRGDFVVAPGSRLTGRYSFAWSAEDGGWLLSIDWYALEARGPSRVRNLGRRPPLFTLTTVDPETVPDPDTAPTLAKGSLVPLRYFNLAERDRNRDGRLVPLEALPGDDGPARE